MSQLWGDIEDYKGLETEDNKYDVFLICPVRNADQLQKERMQLYINNLELKGLKVYYPARDTKQEDDTGGFRICLDNRNAIVNSKEIHIFWDKTSQGSLFDLGMAFSLSKRLVIVNLEDLELSTGKSFSNMIFVWQNQ